MSGRSLNAKKYHNYSINWINLFLILWILLFFIGSILFVAWSYQATVGF